MASPKDLFEHSGPKHLSFMDWNCPHQRRSVAACLVQGAYVLERDRQREENLELAPPWWEFCHFSLYRRLVDDADDSIFGAIYQYTPHQSTYNPSAESAPRYVVAFRGTVIDSEALVRDAQLNWRSLQNLLHKTSRFESCMEAVRNLVSVASSSKIWLAGHSLGSALAALVGKNMAKNRVLLETFLFNPPFMSLPIGRIKDNNLKQGIQMASSFLTAVLNVAMKEPDELRSCDASLSALASWVPKLFLNPKDHICSEYIGYFENRQRLNEIGAKQIERLGSRNALSDIVLGAFGRESETYHLFPSARLTINQSFSPDFISAHKLAQWWRPDLNLQCLCYLDDC